MPCFQTGNKNESLKFWNLHVQKEKKTIEKQNRKEKYIYLTVFPQRRF